jgi:hypothetical protein
VCNIGNFSHNYMLPLVFCSLKNTPNLSCFFLPRKGLVFPSNQETLSRKQTGSAYFGER